MAAYSAKAPGKIILFGEHAVVYGQPALAVPVLDVGVWVRVQPAPDLPKDEVRITASDVGLHNVPLASLGEGHPLALALHLTLKAIGARHMPAARIWISSTIPVAAGLGSGAAVSVALTRAVSGFLGRPLPAAEVNAIAYEVEKIHHGTPSGIDNTVIAFAKPVYFVRGRPVETFKAARAFTLVIADSGIPAPTAETVADVRRAYQSEPERYGALFAEMGQVARQARRLIERGEVEKLGVLMDANHRLLREIGVSSEPLERLVHHARAAGALGAKLSGGGRGGNIIALVPPTNPERRQEIARALESAGAVRTIITTVA